jgi:hypothetical protein
MDVDPNTPSAKPQRLLGDVELPDALARKYPKAPYEWGWKFVFPSHKLSTDPATGGKGVRSPLDIRA